MTYEELAAIDPKIKRMTPTGATWLWVVLFSSLYFAVHGLWKHAIISFVLNVFTFWIVGTLYGLFTFRTAWEVKQEDAIFEALKRVQLLRSLDNPQIDAVVPGVNI